MLLEQQALQASGVLRWKLDVAQDDFLHQQSILSQLFLNRIRGQLAHLLAARGEHIANQIIWHHLAENARHHRRHDLLFDGLGQIGMDVIEAPGIQTVAHRDGHAHRQALLGLDFQALCFRFRIVSQRRGEHFLASVVQSHALNQRNDAMYAREKRARQRAGNLAYQDAGPPAGHDDEALSQHKRRHGHERQTPGQAPPDFPRR